MPKFSYTLVVIFFLLSCEPKLPPIVNNYQTELRINQVGYYPQSPKKVVVAQKTEAEHFHLVDLNQMKSVFKNDLSKQQKWDLSGEDVRTGDFSSFSIPGNYSIYIEDIGYSYPFDIKENVLGEAFSASVKALYFQRSSFELEPEYAGIYNRSLGHPDDSVLFHPSTGRTGVVQSPGGWYDAGDYGKYVVNGAYPLGQLLQLYEQYPSILGDNTLQIPESGNGINDYLDELKFEMDWLLTMQDEDGGVFFKLTTERFEGMVLPELAKKQRYLFKKNTAASLDFAAVAAKFSRIFSLIDEDYANKCLEASKSAWDWAISNPSEVFVNPEGVITGQYGDKDFSQEFFWAAAELYLITKSQEYLDHLSGNNVDFTFKPGESWANHMHYLGAFVLIDNSSELPLAQELKEQILAAAKTLVDKTNANAYFQPITDFQWGSNSDVANSAFIIAQAYRINRDPEYLKAVQQITDYILGKNATGYSFLTGIGDNTPQYIHHRPSAGDNIPEPIPGLLAGGPNFSKQDQNEVQYPENSFPMTSWVDQEPSYASNEICLNWNAPLTFVLGFLEQETSK